MRRRLPECSGWTTSAGKNSRPGKAFPCLTVPVSGRTMAQTGLCTLEHTSLGEVSGSLERYCEVVQ